MNELTHPSYGMLYVNFLYNGITVIKGCFLTIPDKEVVKRVLLAHLNVSISSFNDNLASFETALNGTSSLVISCDNYDLSLTETDTTITTPADPSLNFVIPTQDLKDLLVEWREHLLSPPLHGETIVTNQRIDSF